MNTPYSIDHAAELKCRGIVQQEQLSCGICVCLTKAQHAQHITPVMLLRCSKYEQMHLTQVCLPCSCLLLHFEPWQICIDKAIL